MLLAAAVASPSPAPSPALKTIVTVKASAFCGAFAAHINSAITSAVNNDQTLGETITVLRSSDLSGTTLVRQREIHRLEDLSVDIYRRYRDGENEVKALRELAAKSSDPDEKRAVTDAANALGGALYRQHLVQIDLQGFVAYLYASDMASDFDDQTGANAPDQTGYQYTDEQYQPAITDYWFPPAYARERLISPVTLVGHQTHDQEVEMAQAASDEFRSRLPAIFSDEMNAGSNIETASGKCE